MSPLARLALAVLICAAAPGARAQATPPPAAIEALAPATYVARQDGAPVRVDPGFVYREIGKLAKGDKVTIDGRQGQWLRVRGGGWVFEEHVWTEAQAAAAPPVASKLVVIKEGARVRESASTAAPVVATLHADDVVDATAELDGWWKLASGGYIATSLVRPQDATPLAAAAARASQPGRPLPWVVAADSANVRSGRGPEFPVVGRAVRGEIVVVSSVVDGWAEVPGGWIRQDLLQPPAPPKPAASSASAPSSSPAKAFSRRWSFMDLDGVLVEVYEFPDDVVPEGIRAEMRAQGQVEWDWTVLGIGLSVSADSKAPFFYSPKDNATRVRDSQGQPYGNIYAKGPISKLPAQIRLLLDEQVLYPGDRFNGALLFRPTLKPSEISAITFQLKGAVHQLIPDR